jgi:hypothetical protein
LSVDDYVFYPWFGQTQSYNIGLVGLGLWHLTPLLTIFQLPVYRNGQFYWWRKLKYPEKTTKQTLSHNVVLSTPRLSRIQTHNVSGDR